VVTSRRHAVFGPPAEAAPIQAGRAAGWAAVFARASRAVTVAGYLLIVVTLVEAGTRAGVGSGPGSGGRWVASRG
jgi:hypothetical protein